MSADLPGIRARLAAATPGLWVSDIREDGRAWIELPGVDGHAFGVHGFPADADLIAHAPTDLTALLAEVERLQESSDTWRREAKRLLEGKRRQAAVIDAVTKLADEWEVNGEVQIRLLRAALNQDKP